MLPMQASRPYDVAFIGHYTQDTIVLPHTTSVSPGGGFLFGSYVIAQMGLRAAVITRLAREDEGVVDDLRRHGIAVMVTLTPETTHERMIYGSDNPDDRALFRTGFAGPFTPEEVSALEARAVIVTASIRGEVPLAVVQALAEKGSPVTIDLQGYLRVEREGAVVSEMWPEAEQFLRCARVVKADMVEAGLLTGSNDAETASRAIAALGPKEVMITSRQGVSVLAEGEFHWAPWCAQSMAGRTGRGDTCIAAYVGKRLSAPAREALIWAAALTSLKMEKPGPFAEPVSKVEELILREYSPRR